MSEPVYPDAPLSVLAQDLQRMVWVQENDLDPFSPELLAADRAVAAAARHAIALRKALKVRCLRTVLAHVSCWSPHAGCLAVQTAQSQALVGRRQHGECP